MLSEVNTTGRRRKIPLLALLARMRQDGCGALAGKAELLTGIEGVSSRRKGRCVESALAQFTKRIVITAS